MTLYSKPELEAMSKSKLVALAQALGVQVCDDLNLLVYNIIDAQTNAYIKEYEKKTRRKASPKAKTKTKSKTERNRTNEEWAKSQLEKVEEEMKPQEQKTLEQFTLQLKRMGCQYQQIDEETVFFKYQGGCFQAFFRQGAYVWLYYHPFLSIESYQKDKQERAKVLVNEMNCQYSPRVAYAIDPDDGELVVWATELIVYFAQVPEMGEYLSDMLDGFFYVQHTFIAEMEEKEQV